MYITKKDRLLIKTLISEAEKKTRAEVVPMIIHHSDNYPAAHFRAAIIVSFIFSLALYYSPLSVINPIYYLWIQIPGLFFGYWLGHIPIFKSLLITKDEIEHEVTQRAYVAFFDHNLHLTENHNGVLILISLMEKKIKIITDKGISSKVDSKIWNEILANFSNSAKNGNIIKGLTEVITSVTTVLENYFPNEDQSQNNELANDLIVEAE